MTDHLEVRRDGALVGHLRRSGSRLWLTYSDEVLASIPAGTPVVSCSLPVRSGRLDASAWTRGLLPEGQHLNALAALADVAASDTFGLLARFGRDVAGAFEITSADPPPCTPSTEAYTDDTLDAEVAGLPDTPLGVHADSGLSLAGLQDKLVLVRDGDGWARPVNGYPSTHILKVDPPTYPGIVDAEAACLRLAKAVGLTDVDVERRVVGGREALIVSRFDRTTLPDGTTRRRHQEDLLQAIGLGPDDRGGRAKYQRTGTPGPPSWWHAADVVDTYAPDPRSELLRQVRIVTFTVATGNADAHAKNLAFLVDDGRVALAPLYDTVPTALWPNLRASAALSVNDVGPMTDITVEDLVTEARRWRVPEDDARSAVLALLDELEANLSAAGHEGVERLVRTNVARLLTRRS